MKKILWALLMAAMLLCLSWVGATADPIAINDYTLILNDNYDGGAVATLRFVSSYKLPARTRKGYTMQGWSLTRDGAAQFEDKAVIELESDLTLYAVWLVDGLEYSYTQNDNITITGYHGTAKDIDIPYIVDQTPVVAIMEGAFQNHAELTGITIPDSVTSIGKTAFSGCTGLTRIRLPESMTHLSEYLFVGCTGLEQITIPASVTDIGTSAFAGCTGLTDIAIPSSVESIGDRAFFGCTGLRAITIPSGVTSIGIYAFDSCTGLKDLAILSSNTSIGRYAFYRCIGLVGITLPEGLTHLWDYLFCGCSGLKEIALPNTVTSIGDSAFSGCKNLKTITLPNTLKSIGKDAFSGCSGLTEITIPPGVTDIGENAFKNCSALTEIAIPAGMNSIGYSAFSGCEKLTGITLPEGMTYLWDSLYSKCAWLKEITIPGTVTSIGKSTFSGCTGLMEITIPDTVTSIGRSAFSDCTGLTEITIPSGMSSIKDLAFYCCTGLTEITIPSSVTDIEDMAFYGCSSLSTICFEGTSAQWDRVSKDALWNSGCPSDQKVVFIHSVAINKNMEGGAVTGAGKHAAGDTVTLAAVPEAGWRFAGWQVVSGDVTIEDNRFTMPDEDVVIQAVFERVYAIASTDGTAVALRFDGWLGSQVATEAAEGEELSLEIADGAVPAAGQYFTGEFSLDGVSLGRGYEGLNSWPIADFIMPGHSIDIAALQAEREAVTLEFSQSPSLSLSWEALMQLRDDDATAALFVMDEEWNEYIDLNQSGVADLAVTGPDWETTADATLTLLPEADATGVYVFPFAGATDRYSSIEVILSVPTAFGTPDLELPANLLSVGANAFEGGAMHIVSVPSFCASIGDYAFRNCLRLTQIRIPRNCTLGTDVFDGCIRVYVFGSPGTSAESYCNSHDNCIFVEIDQI